jgi:hypothetical protein
LFPLAEYGHFDRRLGLFEVCQAICHRHSTSYFGQPSGYYAAAVRNEAERDVLHLHIKNTDRLELDPKGKRRMNRVVQDSDSHTEEPVALLPDTQTPGQESLLGLFREATEVAQSPHERELLMLIARGMNPSEACVELDMPRRRWENLQDRLRRRLSP